LYEVQKPTEWKALTRSFEDYTTIIPYTKTVNNISPKTLPV
jgi:hypothetical protein